MAELLLIPSGHGHGHHHDDRQNDDDDACFEKDSSSVDAKKRKLEQPQDDECPGSPVPSLYSEPSASSSSSEPGVRGRKRGKHGTVRKVCFDIDPSTDDLNTRLNVYDKYDEASVDEIWWSKNDLMNIMKREGRLVLDLKLSPNNGASCVASSLKRSINEAFKQCVDEPSAIAQDSPIFEYIRDDCVGATRGCNEHTPGCTRDHGLTTTRGLERYVAPILGAHREMVVRSLLTTQQQLEGQDPSLRTQVLGARYQHMCKVAANFAIVMARCDARLASGATTGFLS